MQNGLDCDCLKRGEPSGPLTPAFSFQFNMRTLIAILTALHVLAHGIFGCCDHGGAAAGTNTPACVCHHAEHGGHEHGESGDHHADDVAEPASDCLATDEESPASAPHRCIHASCYWLAADVVVSQHTFDFNCLAAFDANSASLASALNATEFWPDSARGQVSAPPLRLHLALGVLLI
jgi:hypothetical protein